ncbi:T9SS type B sorting domain-containing protein [Flavobacterium sp. 3-210]
MKKITFKFKFYKLYIFISAFLLSITNSNAQLKITSIPQSGTSSSLSTSPILPSGIITSWSDNILTIIVPKEMGEFDYKILLEGNCDATVGKILVKPKLGDIITNKTICEGESYTWPVNNTNYTTAQTGLRISNDECIADEVLNLTVTPKPADVVTTETICSGSVYNWSVDGKTYTVSGTYRKINDGCTADQVLNLTVGSKPADLVTTKSICSGQTYIWPINGITYSQSTSLRIQNDGCTADQVLDLTVTPKPADLVTTETICSGQTYIWPANGITYSRSVSLRIQNDGCTADQVLDLTVTPKPADVVTTETICSGTVYNWSVDGKTYTVSGTYRKINDGCTADQVLNLTVGSKPVDLVTTKSICSGQTYIWPINGITYSQSTLLRIQNDGCTADQVLDLTVTPKPADVVTTETICSGSVYNWSVDGKTYTVSGTYRKINDGCTADQVLNLTVGSKPADLVTTKSICSGQTYIWPANGITYSQSTLLRIQNDGCTADQVLDLTVTLKPADVVTTETICSGTVYNWSVDGKTYTVSGTYRKINDGCTADQILNLIVTAKPADVVTTKTICAGETYTWPANNINYTTSQIALRISNDGCTADQVLNLIVKPKPDDIITNATICSGKTYTWAANGNTYSTKQTGLRISNNDCTADQVLNLTIVTAKPADIITDVTICAIESYTWPANGQTYKTTQKGLKIINDSCTADQVLNLTVMPMHYWSAGICGSNTFTWEVNNVTYSETGIYIAIKNGECHSLTLSHFDQPSAIITNETICEGQSYKWPVNNITYTTTQTVSFNPNQCEPERILNLTVTPKPADIITNATICAGYGYLWEANGQYYTTKQSGLRIRKNGCTADQVLNLTVTPKPADIITNATICSGESYIWPANNLTYTTAKYGLRIKNNNCTADEILNLTITPKPADIITNVTISKGESYTWPANNVTYTTAQNRLKIVNNGCTADQVLNLTVTAKPADVVTNAVICAGGNYTWAANNTSYTTAQSGLKIAGNDNTADQILNLVVSKSLSATILSESLSEICEGDKNAEFTISISGGSLPYSVAIDDTNFILISGNEHTFQNLSGGVHNVYIKDNLNCTTTLEVHLPNSVSINPVATIQYNCVDNLPSNSATVNINPAITNASEIDYTLDGNSGRYQSSPIFTNISPGKHFIRARHTNTCEQDTEEFTIEAFDPLVLTLSNTELNEISATASGGNGDYRYSFESEPFSTTNKFTISKTGNYTVSVTDKNGCNSVKTIFAKYIDICIPNYFTPNGDGINDFWSVGCTTSFKNLNCSIFDRYGREIGTYRLNEKWDGKIDGKELPSGDYWYTLKLNDPEDNREFVGHFTLYR